MSWGKGKGRAGVTLGLPVTYTTEGNRGNIEEKKIISLLRDTTRINGRGHDGSTIGNGLVSVDAYVLAVKEVGNEFDYAGDTSGTTDQDDFVNVRLVDLRVMEDLFNRG